MPDMDGFETCRQIQTLPGGNRTPVLIITTLDDDESIKRAFDAGASDYIAKPVRWDILRRRLHYMARTRQAEKKQRASEEELRKLSQAVEHLQ